MTGNDSQFNNISTHEVCLHVIIMFCAQPDGYANGNFRYSLPPFSWELENATKGPYIKDVRKIVDFLDPLPPLSANSLNLP